MSRGVKVAVTLLALVLCASRADASEATAQVRFGSCAADFDTDETAVLLQRELDASLGRPVSLSVVAPSSPWDPVDVAITVVCEVDTGDVSVTVLRRASTPSQATSRVSLTAIPRTARPRLVALSSAETAHFLVTEATSVALPEPVLRAPVAAAAQVGRSLRRLRVTRGVGLGLGALTVASVVVGIVLATSESGHDHDRHHPDSDEAGIGVAFGMGGLSLVGTSVDVGVWMRERSFVTTSTMPARAATPSLLRLSF
jgi:hypothetical protein